MEPNKNNSAKVVSLIALMIVAVGVLFYSARNFNKQEDAKEVASVSETSGAGRFDDDKMPVETPVTTPVQKPVYTPSTKPSTPPSKTPTPTPAKTTKYKNGTYTATGVYATPEGGDSIDVTLTVKDDVIVDANVSGNSSIFSTSGNYQRRFIATYKQYVVGKKLDSAQLSAVSGASLTSNGFNTALARIKAQARA